MLCMTCCLLDARDVQHVGESSPVDVQQLRENRKVKHEVNGLYLQCLFDASSLGALLHINVSSLSSKGGKREAQRSLSQPRHQSRGAVWVVVWLVVIQTGSMW